ncbi:MAG: thioredoxin family protein [Oligoflexia bacterium]|nr:thioredoxin family protein [Oligoflexia bacterium]
MARTPSRMKDLGSIAYPFTLKDSFEKTFILNDSRGKPLLIMFICNHCPFVKHIFNEIIAVGNFYQKKGFSVYAINSNDYASYPDDSPENMKKEVTERSMEFPYLVDEDQTIAKKYEAACTPDFFIYDETHKLIYRGQFDASRPGNDVPVTGDDLKFALDQWVQKKEVVNNQKPSLGCNIKWKSGKEPDYYLNPTN